MNHWFLKAYAKAGFSRKFLLSAAGIVSALCAAGYFLIFWPAGQIALMWTRRRPPEKAAISLQAAKRILLIRLDKIGDFVLTTPFLRELRKNAPQSEITLVVSAEAYPLAALCPYVDTVENYGKFPALGIFGLFMPPLRAFFYARKHLWNKHFDLAVNLRWSLDFYHAAYLAFFSGAMYRAGHSELAARERRFLNFGQHHLLTHALESRMVRHEAEQSLELLAFLGGKIDGKQLELWTAPGDEARIDHLLKQHGVSSASLSLAVCPGAGMPKREWPVENYITLIGRLQKKQAVPVFIIGSAADRPYGVKIQEALDNGRIINLCGELSLPQTYALLKRCAGYLGGDTGPMHMAAAARIFVAAISCHPADGEACSSNSPARVGPWCENSVVLQPSRGLPPCRTGCDEYPYPHCITQVTVDQVERALAACLDKIESQKKTL